MRRRDVPGPITTPGLADPNPPSASLSPPPGPDDLTPFPANPEWPTYVFMVENMSATQADAIARRLRGMFPYVNVAVTNARGVVRFPPEAPVA